MQRPSLLLLALTTAACDLLQLGSGTATSTGESTAGAGGAASGSYCGADPNTGVTLCLGITLCPGLTVDNATYPGCGFRVSGAALDVECVCGGFLCPLGSAASCDEVSKLLAASFESEVCAQAGGGACTEIGSTGTSSSPSSGATTCDTVCRNECAGDPGCIVLCGC